MDIKPRLKLRNFPAIFTFSVVTLGMQPSFAMADDIEHILVLGRTENTTAMDMAANVNVIDSSDIQLSGATNLVDLLRGQYGIQISDNNTNAVISMRGFTSGQAANNTLILVDGRKLNNIDIAAPALSSIPLNMIERIEVLSGSAGVLYGDQAVGGVINIITRAPDRDGGNVTVSGGSFNAREARADYAGQFADNWHYYVSGSQKNSDNYRDHNASKTGAVLGRIGYLDDTTNFYFESSYFDNNVETPGALTKAEFDQNPRQSLADSRDYQHDMTYVIRSGVAQQLNTNWQFAADVNYSDSLVTSFSWGSSGRNERDLLAINPKAIGNYETTNGDLNLVVGADLSRGNSDFGNRSNEQTLLSGYVQATVPLNTELSYVVGGRYSRVEDDLKDASVYPNGIKLDESADAYELGLNYQLNDQQRFYIRGEDNFRFAKVDEQAYTSPGVIGLKPQTGRSYEAGWDFTENFIQARINLYRLNLEDEIIFDPSAQKPVGGGFNGANVNAEASRRYGANAGFDWMIVDSLQLGMDYSYIDAEFTEGVNKGKSLSWVAKHNGRIYGSWDLTNEWQLYSDVVYTGGRFIEGDNANIGEKLASYTLVNMAVNYNYQNWLASLRLDNILDKEYVSASYYSSLGSGYYSGTGRDIRLTVNYQF